MVQCESCPSTFYKQLPAYNGSCSKECGFVYNQLNNICQRCDENQEPSVDGLTCIDCPPGYYSENGEKCTQIHECNNGQWECNDCRMEWRFNNTDFNNYIDSEINELCCPNNLYCNYRRVHQGYLIVVLYQIIMNVKIFVNQEIVYIMKK